jgi:energy-coupling factor transporter ATP-binding protein EcfA2
MRSDGASVHATRTRPLVVEFIGTPGSGKTTLSVELAGLLHEHGISAGTVVGAAREHALRTRVGAKIGRIEHQRLRSVLLWQLFYAFGTMHAFAFARERWALTRLVMRTQMRPRLHVARRRHVLWWFFQMAGRYRFMLSTARPSEAVVFDDGFLHRSVHLYASDRADPSAQEIASYVDLLPSPDVVVFAVAGRDVCESRVRTRGVWHHSRRLPAWELSRYLANAECVTDFAVRRARERGWTVVAVNNGGRPIDRVRRDLVRALEPCLAVKSRMARRERESTS